MDGNGNASIAPRPGPIVGGVVLLLLGGTMLLDRTGVADIPVGRLIGPACLITIGTLMLLGEGMFVCGRRERMPDGTMRMNARKGGSLTGGFWILGVGCWMLVSQLHVFGLDYGTSWPLLIILSGVIILMRGAR
jgi:hypothetical protein